MGIQNRPYVGTWKLSGKEVVQVTPDALLYINGDLTLPGCSKCSGRIDLQKYITEISVDSGTDPTSSSMTCTLTVPMASVDPFIRDANYLLRLGLELHVYMRGYFPVKGLFTTLDEPGVGDEVVGGGAEPLPTAAPVEPARDTQVGEGPKYTAESLFNNKQMGEPDPQSRANMGRMADNMNTIQQYFDAYRQAGGEGQFPGYASGLRLRLTPHGGFTRRGVGGEKHAENSEHHRGNAIDFDVVYTNTRGQEVAVNKTVVWAGLQRLRSAGYIEQGGIGAYTDSSGKWVNYPPHYDRRGDNRNWYNLDEEQAVRLSRPTGFGDVLARTPNPQTLSRVQPYNKHQQFPSSDVAPVPPPPLAGDLATSENVTLTPSLLAQNNLSGMGIDNLLAYPYYHVFHGVVTGVQHQYAGGVHTITLTGSSMLNFWQYQQMSTQASMFGTRPSNSGNRISWTGNNFTGMHPYEIMYFLHHDTAGAAAGVSWALSDKTNQDAVSSVTGESLYSLNLRYWEERFRTTMTRLRFYGINGELYSTVQAAFLAKSKGTELSHLIRNRYLDPMVQKASKNENTTFLRSAALAGLTLPPSRLRPDGSSLDVDPNAEARPAAGAGGLLSGGDTRTPVQVNLVEMVAYVSNITQWGQLQMFESSYESKLAIAQKVCEVTGFEFFQDVDGDFVFKPPLYNLDTSSSRVYRIEDIDIININFDEKEPVATFITGKGEGFKNLGGTGLEGEWGVRGQYVDFRLVAQFGWRGADFETSYYNDKTAIFFSAVSRLDILNAPCHSASLTIPLRPELRPGFPVYIRYLDCFYYCPSFAHSYSVGGSCTTSLQLIAKRAKFFAPGKYGDRATAVGPSTLPGLAGGIEQIDLSNTRLPERPLQVLDGSGQPRLAGFPNVVMTLDPDRVNPMFFIVGSDLGDLSDERTLQGIVQRALDMKVLVELPSPTDKGTEATSGIYGYVTSRDPQTGAPTYGAYFTLNDQPPATAVPPAGTAEIKTISISKMAAEYRAKWAAYTKGASKPREDLKRLQRQAAQAQADIRAKSIEIGGTKDPNRKRALEGDIEEAKGRYDDAVSEALDIQDTLQKDRDAIEESQGKDLTETGIGWFLRVMKELQAGLFPSNNDYDGDLNSTYNLLDMLGDKKASFSPGSGMPGTYRYYSCSHPDKEMQGQPSIKVINGRLTTTEDTIDSPWATQVVGFVPSPEIKTEPGQPRPEAQMREIPVRRGIRVTLGRKGKPNEVVPTSAIREILFGVAEVTKGDNKRAGNSAKGRKPSSTLPGSILGSLASQLELSSGQATATTTLGDYAAGWNRVVAKSRDAAVSSVTPSVVAMPVFPKSISVNGKTYVTGTPFLFSAGGTQKFGRMMVTALARDFKGQFDRNLRAWTAALKANGVPQTDRAEAAIGVVDAMCSEVFGGAPSVRPSSEVQVANQGRTHQVPVPVFPVSDAKGYRVVGSYRYGRDIDIDAQGVWGSLRSDAFAFLDRDTVENVIRVFIERQGKVQIQEKNAQGEMVTVTVDIGREEQRARNGVEQEVLKQLQSRMDQKQLLDLGLLYRDGNTPNKLSLKLSNWFADGRESVQKVPVNNAAYSLADLMATATPSSCDCKAAEASTMLEAFGQTNFVQVSAPGASLPVGYGDGSMSQTVKWVSDVTALASAPWARSQQALRGQVLRTTPTDIISAFKPGAGGAFDRLVGNWDEVKAQAEEIRQSGRSQNAAWTTAVEDAWNEEG